MNMLERDLRCPVRPQSPSQPSRFRRSWIARIRAGGFFLITVFLNRSIRLYQMQGWGGGARSDRDNAHQPSFTGTSSTSLSTRHKRPLLIALFFVLFLVLYHWPEDDHKVWACVVSFNCACWCPLCRPLRLYSYIISLRGKSSQCFCCQKQNLG